MRMYSINVAIMRQEWPHVRAQIRALREMPDVTIFGEEIAIEGPQYLTIKIDYCAHESHRDIFEAA